MADAPRKGVARTCAREILKKYGITGAPTPIEKILKGEQLEVIEMHWGNDGKVGGLLVRADRVIFLNIDHPPARRRFSLAHELGHWALRHDDRKKDAEQRMTVDIDHPPDEQEGHNNAVWEWEANTFANELLVPRATLVQYRSKPRREQPEDERPFHNPFAVFSQKGNGKQLSEAQLAELFQVSKEVLFIALKEHQLI